MERIVNYKKIIIKSSITSIIIMLGIFSLFYFTKNYLFFSIEDTLKLSYDTIVLDGTDYFVLDENKTNYVYSILFGYLTKLVCFISSTILCFFFSKEIYKINNIKNNKLINLIICYNIIYIVLFIVDIFVFKVFTVKFSALINICYMILSISILVGVYYFINNNKFKLNNYFKFIFYTYKKDFKKYALCLLKIALLMFLFLFGCFMCFYIISTFVSIAFFLQYAIKFLISFISTIIFKLLLIIKFYNITYEK